VRACSYLHLFDAFEAALGEAARHRAAHDIDTRDTLAPLLRFDAFDHHELFRSFEADLEAIRGIHDVLDVVTQAVCVASSGSHQRMRVSLGSTGLYDRLAPNIFSASQVKNGKPAPDLFLFAANEMGVRPERCVVIEDSLAGIAGARAAGMTVFGFCGGSHCGDGHAETLRQAGADLTFADMHQLPDLVRRVDADALAG